MAPLVSSQVAAGKAASDEEAKRKADSVLAAMMVSVLPVLFQPASGSSFASYNASCCPDNLLTAGRMILERAVCRSYHSKIDPGLVTASLLIAALVSNSMGKTVVAHFRHPGTKATPFLNSG